MDIPVVVLFPYGQNCHAGNQETRNKKSRIIQPAKVAPVGLVDSSLVPVPDLSEAKGHTEPELFDRSKNSQTQSQRKGKVWLDRSTGSCGRIPELL
jgi:hypothetical protein